MYFKPSSKKKTLFMDHISHAFHVLSRKYGKGLHFIISGDTNHLQLEPILSLSPTIRQIVTDFTRSNPPAILDTVITTLGNYYQIPVCLEPLGCDPDKKGKASDHKIVVVRPINALNNKSSRTVRKVKVRPFTKSGLEKMKEWFLNQTWSEIYTQESAHDKAALLKQILFDALNEFFPVKVRTFASDDQPWITHKIKLLDRKRKRIYRKQRRSEDWKKADKLFKAEVKEAKKSFYHKMIADTKTKKPGQWYSALKRISSYDQRENDIQIEEISHLTDKEQVEIIADVFTSIPNSYDDLKTDDISVPPFTEDQIPQFKPSEVWLILTKLKSGKATVEGDFPVSLIKQFAAYIAEPLTDIYNTSIKLGQYPNVYKFEVSTPVPKSHPPKTTKDIRNISGLLTFDKVFEKLLSKLMISDMSSKMDPSQYGNKKGISIQHYLIKMLDRILSALDNNRKGEVSAVVANFIDWNNAFPRQCPKLGVESFVKNGVRPALIPLLVNFFQDRSLSVKWHGLMSSVRKVKGGGPQGATLGLLEYVSQSNDCADSVPEGDRFRFLDDLSILDIVNLLSVKIASYDLKNHIPNDIPSHNMYIPGESLKSQEYLNKISDWTQDHKGKINTEKSKTMIFNFTENHQFGTRLQMEGNNLEVVKKIRLLGTIITEDLSWNENTAMIVKKANARLELLRKISSFGASVTDLKDIYLTFVRSILEQSATVWHSSISKENRNDLERVQKTAFKLILGNKYKTYKNALELLDLDTLETRREELCLKFALKASNHPECKDLFPLNTKSHAMATRKSEKYKINHANTERLKSSSIIYMQKLLNKHTETT